LLATLKTNEIGIATFIDSRDIKDLYSVAKYKVELGADSCLQAENLNSNSYRWERTVPYSTQENTINIFTDRSIYRPGQTVYFKAIVIDKESKVLANQTCTIELLDVNDETVTEKEIITNEFGSASGEFILPQSGLLGQYSIMATGGGAGTNYFKVEEYKRPTFEITFDKLKETYAFGEEIKLKGYAKIIQV
jgi:Large extracellular alpha-helical protein